MATDARPAPIATATNFEEDKMPKQPSIITVARMGGGYSVDARGALGGGWTRPTPAEELTGTILRAWQQYGSNPLGCEIVGEMPTDTQAVVDKLRAVTSDDGQVVLTLRLP